MSAIRASRKNEPSHEGEHLGTFMSICRWWLPFIGSRDLFLVLAALDLTLGRRWKNAHYHVGDLTDGVTWTHGDKTRTHHGSTLSRSSIFRSRKSLEAIGLMSFRQDHRAGYIIQINSEWEPEGLDEALKRRMAFFRRHRRKPHDKVRYLWQPAKGHYHLRAARLACNEWLHRLNGAEMKIMLMLVECSFGKRKTECHLTVDQLRLGVMEVKGQGMWCVGTGLSTRTIYNALASLEQKGAIHQRKGIGSGYILAINTGKWSEAAAEATQEEADHAPEPATEEGNSAPEPVEIPVLSAAILTPDHCNPDTHPTINRNNNRHGGNHYVLTTAGEAPLRRDTGEEIPRRAFTGSSSGRTPHSPSPLAPSASDMPCPAVDGRLPDHALGEEGSSPEARQRPAMAEAGREVLRIPCPGPDKGNVIYLPDVSRLLRDPNAPICSRANASSDMNERRLIFEMTREHLLWPEREPIAPVRSPISARPQHSSAPTAAPVILQGCPDHARRASLFVNTDGLSKVFC